MRTACAIVVVIGWSFAGGCRTAVVAGARDAETQTVVTVEERPATNPSDKGLIIRDKR